MPPSLDLGLEKSLQILGSFDISTLMINLAIEPEILARNLQSTLELDKKQAPLVAHELAHFFQTTTTSNGLRMFTLWVDSLVSKWWLIRQATLFNEGELRAPIIRNLPPLSSYSEELKIALLDYTAIVSKQLYHYGGWQLEPGVAEQGERILNNVYVIKDWRLFGHKLAGSLFLMDMRPLDKTEKAIAIGARHLREGAAKAIELIQNRLINGEGQKSFHVSDRERVVRDVHNEPLLDPYYICNAIYTAIVRELPGCDENASLEEFVAIADVACMGDNWLINWQKVQSFHGKERELVLQSLEKIDFAPGDVFFHIMATFTRCWRKLSRLKKDFSQSDLVEFQNALLQEAGGHKLEDILRNCEVFIDKYFADLVGQTPLIPKTLVAAYEKIFKRGIQFRRETLKGGAMLIDLLTSPETLFKLISQMPAIAVGSQVRSWDGRARGEGLGIDMLSVRLLHDVTEALITGNRMCPLHCEIPRGCCNSPSAFCNALSNISGTNYRCDREQMLSFILRSVNAKRLRWVNG